MSGTALLGLLSGTRLKSQDYPAYKSYLGIGLSNEHIAAGIKVGKVIPGSPAAEAGLQVDDVLKAVDGRSVSSAAEAVDLWGTHPPYEPDSVKLEIERAGKTLTLEVRPTGVLRLKVLTPKQVFFIPGVDTGSPFELMKPVVTLDSINVLKRVLVDPDRGTVEFIGTYDPTYDTGAIPYRQLLEDAVRFPKPVFSLDLIGGTLQDKETAKKYELMRHDFDRMYGVGGTKQIREAWSNRWKDLILGHPLLEVDRQLFLDKLASEIGLTKSQLVDLYNYLNLDGITWPVPAAILDSQVRVFEYLGKAQVAKAYRLYAQGTASSLMSAAESLGKADEARQLLAEPELAGTSDSERQAILRAFVLSKIGRSLGIGDDKKAADLVLKVREGKYPVEMFDAFIQGTTRIENWEYWGVVRTRVFNQFPLSNELLEAFYGIAPVQVRLRFEGLDGATALGRVLYEADYTGKWIDNTEVLFPTIKSHKSRRELLGNLAKKEVEFHNTFEPQEMPLTVSANRREIGFGTARIELKTRAEREPPSAAVTDEELAAAQRATDIWRAQINDGYDQYAQAYPPLHRLREAAKVIALARWMNQQGIKPAPDPTAAAVPGWGTGSRVWTPPSRVRGLFANYMEFEQLSSPAGTTRYNFRGIREAVDGGVNFQRNDKWVAILPQPPTYESADDALTTSAALGEAAVQAVLSNDLVKARDLAEQSARAMQGEIDIRRIPGNVPIPGRPIPGIAAPNSARLVKEAARIVHALSGGDGSSGGTVSISPTQRAMLVDLGGELNKAVSGTPVASDFLIKLQTRQASKPPATDVKAPSFCEEFRTATANELTPEQKKFYEARLAEVRQDLETIRRTMTDVSTLNRQDSAELEKRERQVTECYRAAQDRLLEAVALMLIDSPSEIRRKQNDEIHKTLDHLMMKSIVARKSAVAAGETAAIDHKIFALLELQLRFQMLYGQAGRFQKRLEETKTIYDFDRWSATDKSDFKKIKARLLQLTEIVLNEPALAGNGELGAVTNETVFRLLSPYKSVGIGADFLADIVAQRSAWVTATEELEQSTSQPGQAFASLRRRADQMQEQIQCLEGIDLAGTSRPTFAASPAPATAPFDAATARRQQETWAEYLDQQVEISNTLGMKFRLIPPGEFMMGSDEDALSVLRRFDYLRPDDVAGQYPLHKVRITKPFYLGMHEVTLGQFLIFYHDANYKTECERDGKPSLGWNRGEELRANFRPWDWGFADQTQSHPVVLVTWNDAVAFCEWLSRKEGKTYRLPTEAEWEYACKAGTTTRYYFGDDPEDMIRYGNGPDQALRARQPNLTLGKSTTPFPVLRGSDGYAFTSPGGSFQPNSFGLYDMTGNVWEWCGDWHDKRYYEKSPTDDPRGPAGGIKRVLRGGSWNYAPARGRSCDRGSIEPEYRQFGLGFRVVLVP